MTEEADVCDNDARSLAEDRECINDMLVSLGDAALTAVVSVEQRAGRDIFVLPSRSLQHRDAIAQWMQENLSAVRYALREGDYTAREKEWLSGEAWTLLGTRHTLAIEREAYRAVCPRATLWASRVCWLSLLGASAGILAQLVSL